MFRELNLENTYLFRFSENYLRVYRKYMCERGDFYYWEVSGMQTPWNEVQVEELDLGTWGGKVYIKHPSYSPHVIQQEGCDDWKIHQTIMSQNN